MDAALCSIGRNKALLPPKGCWDLGMGLRTRAKELMGLLEAQTVVSARAKLAGSTPTQREAEAASKRRGTEARQLPTTTQDSHFSLVRILGLDVQLYGTQKAPSYTRWVEPSPLGHRLKSAGAERVGYSKRKPLRRVPLQYTSGP